ncbi:MAG: CPBP family intramembrane metalloprotease [Bacteroidia bacterium]|nr:CPBP family intramembrane metalloprotease [Bacteroidia bacterium]
MYNSISDRPPWISVLLIFLTSMVGFIIIGPLIGMLVALPFVEGSFMDFILNVSNPIDHPEIKTPLYILQGCATFFGLIVGPSLYLYSIERKNPFLLIGQRPIYGLMILITAGIVIFFMATNSVFIEWNANLKLPEALKAFESWAREKEDLAMQLTTFLTTFDSIGEFMLAFVVIAILPGIGEELVFRGLLQPELQRATKNIHAAIWISAFLFSAIHMQFFGFVPRVLLGALFGYLYHWSGDLRIAMFAHFINNGFQVVIMYLNQLGVADIDLESPDVAPWPAIAAFTIITIWLLVYLKKFYEARNNIPL